MQVSSRFTVALHILTAIDFFSKDYKVTSDFLSGSIGTNPVIVRRVLLLLKEAGLITVARGTGGCELVKPLDDISFLDVYRAVGDAEQDELFRVHERPNPDCPVGRNIHALLSGRLNDIQSAMEAEMAQKSVGDMRRELNERLESGK